MKHVLAFGLGTVLSVSSTFANEHIPEGDDPLRQAIERAIEERLIDADEAQGLTNAEVRTFIGEVRACWNVGALSAEASDTVVTISVSLDQTGRPLAHTLRQINEIESSEAANNEAYTAAIIAILTCGADGYTLPANKYELWHTVEMVFNPKQLLYND